MSGVTEICVTFMDADKPLAALLEDHSLYQNKLFFMDKIVPIADWKMRLNELNLPITGDGDYLVFMKRAVLPALVYRTAHNNSRTITLDWEKYRDTTLLNLKKGISSNSGIPMHMLTLRIGDTAFDDEKIHQKIEWGQFGAPQYVVVAMIMSVN